MPSYEELALKAIRRSDESPKSDLAMAAATQAVAFSNLAILQELRRQNAPAPAQSPRSWG